MDEDEETRRPAASEGTPPPPVVLHGQLEVGKSDRDARCYDDQDDEDESENSPKRV